MWVQIAIMIVAMVLAYALAPKPPIQVPPTLADFDVPTAEPGRSVPWVFGEGWLTGYNVVWFGDLDTIPVKSSGGKK
jgi:hypothetical protein